MTRGRLSFLAVMCLWLDGAQPCPAAVIPGEGRRHEKAANNFVSLLAEVSTDPAGRPVSFARAGDGWMFISVATRGQGALRFTIDKGSKTEVLVQPAQGNGPIQEAMCHVLAGAHRLQMERSGSVEVERLTVKSIPELMHCGLGFNPAIQSYGVYDLKFLKRDVLPNVTTLIVPGRLKLPEGFGEDWHRQGKRFVAEVGVDAQAKTAGEHAQHWTRLFADTPFLDGVIINEFIVNRPVSEWVPVMTPERLARMDQERAAYNLYAKAFETIGADNRFAKKSIYAYVGGSAKTLNQEIIGTNVLRALLRSGYCVAPERYLHEMSSEQGAREALRAFREGVADWEAKEPGVIRQMRITFGLFSMPPGGLNKLPNVDYHVWMDQQMNLVANDSVFAGLGGLNWWTSLQADEETVRFVGRLYRHYAIEGNTRMLTTDPLFLKHIENADFERGTNGWTLRPAEEGSIGVKSFPRYGRIEGRFMGLGRPADPEHIGDTFLWMKRNAKGPNRFSQAIKNLEPGRLYSMKMMVCDYNDLVTPKAKGIHEARSIATVLIQGAAVDEARSFTEVYASNPEPKIPVCITYHWRVFRAQAAEAGLTVMDWQSLNQPGAPFGEEQAFNFLEIQPYHE